jgi:hypothetical protein
LRNEEKNCRINRNFWIRPSHVLRRCKSSIMLADLPGVSDNLFSLKRRPYE